MIIAIQQSEHLPWVGFFNKMMRIDEFIYLDNVQYKKRYFENRNKIRINNALGWDWITVPTVTKGRYTQKINEVEIDDTQGWRRKYLRKLECAYSKANFFNEIFTLIEEVINKEFIKLLDLNLALINFVRIYLGITKSTILASEICEGKGSDLILDLCIKRKADTYLSGPDGRDYLKLEEFKKNNIQVEYHDYNHCVYGQLYEPFISHMSVIDLLFNYGKDSLRIIES